MANEPQSSCDQPGRVALVAAWHERARQLGLREQQQLDLGGVSGAQLVRLADQHHALYMHALPVMELLHDQIINTHSMVILTDVGGLILHALGDADFLEKAQRVALRPGVTWAEDSKGTNAIGTALAEVRPTLVHGSEHFLLANRFLTCSCSPIRDPHGRVIGALDVSGARESYHAHTMALVRMSTQMIENHLFVDRFGQMLRVHFHLRGEFLGTINEGIVAFDPAGRFVAANPAALIQLSLPREALTTHSLQSLFGVTVGALFDRQRGLNPLTLCLPNGVRVSARVGVHAPLQAKAQVRPRNVPAPPEEVPRSWGRQTLRDLDLGDPAFGEVLARLRKVQGHPIPIMIRGETGTGKEVLARAIHNESHRRDMSFVAIECAAIPESLIEAELFGYEEGAFTGARRRGTHGRLLTANGGTLFLDEIGDMPLALQTRLLRVLQERTITPLGSDRSLSVDIAVICATHRDLREMIQQGQFREDLYYRLNGLSVHLPPLRERCDLAVLIARILERECTRGPPPEIAPEVLSLLQQYGWPGNIRQLVNVLRTAAAMAADDGTVRRRHLPDDFLEEVNGRQLPESATTRAGRRAPTLPDGGADRCRRPLRQVQLDAIRAALEEQDGNVSAAARLLGVSRNTIYRALSSRAD